jgi:peptide/nickel transport system substrate-binding protein
MRRALRAAAGLTAVAVLATACGGGDGGGGGGDAELASGGTFNYTLNADPGNLDPQQTVLLVTNRFNQFTYDYLVAFTPDGEAVSNIAESWEADATTASFVIRDDVACDDGSTLTASDVKANFDYIQDPANGSPIVGTTLPDGNFTTTADDATRTFTVTMANPYGFLLQAVSGVPIVCAAGLADRSLMARGSAGTGPFKVTEAVADDHYTLTKREGYVWGPDGASTDDPGMPDQVVIKIVANETTASNLLLTGELNAVQISGVDQERLRAQGMYESATDQVVGEMWWNQKPGHPTTDPAVREALALALDREELAKVSTGSTGSLLTGMSILEPRGCRYDSVPADYPDQDLDKAGQLLDDAGWTKGADGVRTKDGEQLTIRLLYKSGLEDLNAAIELLSATWRDDLGVVVDGQGLTDTAIVEATFSGDDWDATWLTLNTYLPSQAVGFVSGPGTADGGSNFSGIDNATYTEAATKAKVTAGDEGCELWKQAEEALFTEYDLIPISQAPTPVFGKGAEFDSRAGGVIPTSIRMLAG